MKRAISYAIFLLVMGTAAVSIYAQEKATTTEKKAEPQEALISGEVVSVDLDKSVVVVKEAKDGVIGIYENINLTVSPETKIVKGKTALKLSELKAGDKVKVESSSDKTGTSKVVSITVENQEPAQTKSATATE